MTIENQFILSSHKIAVNKRNTQTIDLILYKLLTLKTLAHAERRCGNIYDDFSSCGNRLICHFLIVIGIPQIFANLKSNFDRSVAELEFNRRCGLPRTKVAVLIKYIIHWKENLVIKGDFLSIFCNHNRIVQRPFIGTNITEYKIRLTALSY